MKTKAIIASIVSVTAIISLPCHAEVFRGVEFPEGIRSFADAVVSYAPGSPLPSLPHQGGAKALGPPDSDGDYCQDQDTCGYVSLGQGGSITLHFTDNALTGSGTTNLDLWVFEIGTHVEDTFVEISRDGTTWHSLGKVFGSTSGIDLDAFGFGLNDRFAFVRLTDDPNEGPFNDPSTPGADIDAVGAIASTNLPPRLEIRVSRVSQVELCWQTHSNEVYQIECREDLSTNTWIPFGRPTQGDGRRFCTNDAVLPAQTRRFYQLSVTDAPCYGAKQN